MQDNPIFVTLAGSHAHGTAGPQSDIDLRGVCIAPLPVRLSLYRQFEQYEGAPDARLWSTLLPQVQAHETAHRSLGGKVEAVIYDIAKFLQLCASANPNALEILFADQRDWLTSSEAWKRIYDARDRFLTKKLEATYLGYGLGQLKKILLHRGWLLHPPKAPPTRAQYGLPESSLLSQEDRNRIEQAVADKARSYGIDDLELPKSTRIQLHERLHRFTTDARSCTDDNLDNELTAVATASLQLPHGIVRTFEAERRFRAAQKHWASYQAWQRRRNPARAELERRHGYDTKHAAHLLRLLETGVEIIQTGQLHVRRANASQLVAVMNGAYTYEQLIERATELQAQMRQAMQHCALPADVDYAFVDDLLVSLVTRD